MPSYASQLSGAEIDDVVTYLRTMKGPPFPPDAKRPQAVKRREAVSARAADQHVVAGTTEDRVVAAGADQYVIAGSAKYRDVKGRLGDRSQSDGVVAIAAEDHKLVEA
jgi:hypothetical protein